MTLISEAKIEKILRTTDSKQLLPPTQSMSLHRLRVKLTLACSLARQCFCWFTRNCTRENDFFILFNILLHFAQMAILQCHDTDVTKACVTKVKLNTGSSLTRFLTFFREHM